MQILVTTKTLRRGIWLVLLFASLAGHTRAQSTDVAWPSPVRSNEVMSRIAARDIGDPRVTDHFYAFTGTPGDVLITVDSRNLNGDIDIFTYSGLRPLLKFTVYAGSSSPITKSIYLRKREDLIVRVEGRTPNDDEAAYRLRFGGAFEPITSGPLAEHEDAIQAATAGVESEQKGRRVSSVGARIEEPRIEVVEAPAPQPTPVESTESEPKVATTKPTPRSTRVRRPVTRRKRPAEPPKSEEATAKSEAENKAPAEGTETPTESTETKAPTATRSEARSKPATTAAETPTAQDPGEAGPRLIIETNDGTLVDRDMSSVRRVTVERGTVVVVGRDGKIQRIPLANVVRMTIAP